MSLTTRVGLLAGASALTLTGASFADNSTEAQDLAAQVAALKAEVAQLKGDNWLTEQRAEEIRGLVQDVLADADTRSSLLQAGMTAGYDDGFVIGSPDGNFSLKLNGQLQVRFVWNNMDDSYSWEAELEELGELLGFAGLSIPDGDDNRWGFENTRTKLMFSGNVVDPTWMYHIEGNFYRTLGVFTLEDAWIAKDMGDGWTLRLGQFKAPHNREWNVHSMNQLAVERSNVSYLYGGGRVQGIALDYEADQFHFIATFNDGAASANGPWSVYDTEWAFGARGEFLFSGTWDQFDDFTSPRGSEQGIMVGAGAHYQNFEFGTSGLLGDVLDQTSVLILTGDVSLEFDGANVFASVNYLDIEDVDSNPLGFTVQGGFYFADDWEAFARFEWNDFDVDDVEWMLLTVGVNGYYSPNVKMTTDIGYGLESVPFAFDVTGWQPDGWDEDGQIVFRTQLQLVF